jgi:cytochrome c-type biogenesis protein CcsB
MRVTMINLAQYAFLAALAATSLAFMFYLASTATGIRGLATSQASTSEVSSGRNSRAEGLASILVVNSLIFLAAAMVLRTIVSGHAPVSNMYEFSIAFSWAALAFSLYIEARYRLRTVTLLVIPMALGLMIYATTVSNAVRPLVPALQNNLLLATHVAVAIFAYGAFAVGCAAGVLYFVQRGMTVRWLPRPKVLEEAGYRAVMVGFPMLGLAVVLGAVWAERAWGSYWSWDPKETASLATWLIYGGYLHARALRGWRGDRSALLLIGGFAATLFTYYGNLFLGGMHSYA